MKDRNATRAAQRAGYKGDANTLGVTGYELLRNPKVDEVIKQRFAESGMSAAEVASLLAEQARGSMDDFVTFYPGGKLPILDLEKASRNGKMRLVKKLKFLPDGGVEFELHDAQAAQVHVGKIHGLFVDRKEVTGKDGGPIEIAQIPKLTDEELERIAASSSDRIIGTTQSTPEPA